MATKSQYAIEIAKLHRTAAESRLKAVASQLALASTLCKIAETEVRYGQRDEAIKVINKLKHHAATIRFHLDEPNHLPSAAVPALREQLEQVQNHAEKIELSLRQG